MNLSRMRDDAGTTGSRATSKGLAPTFALACARAIEPSPTSRVHVELHDRNFCLDQSQFMNLLTPPQAATDFSAPWPHPSRLAQFLHQPLVLAHSCTPCLPTALLITTAEDQDGTRVA